MKIRQYYRTIFSLTTLKDFVVSFFSSLGVYAMFFELADILWPGQANLGWAGLKILFLLSLIPAFILARPRLKFSKYFSTPDTTLTVKVGDIFQETGDLVIGFNDVFDTEIGAVINKNSLQGQFLSQVYDSNTAQLDTDLKDALQSIPSTLDPEKTHGKNARYLMGTVAVLEKDHKKYFCVAYSRMGQTLVASSDISTLWNALDELWRTIRLKGECRKISIPVIGADLARIDGASHSALIKLILMSFIINSRQKIITKDFVLVIHEGNVGKINLKEVQKFLNDI